MKVTWQVRGFCATLLVSLSVAFTQKLPPEMCATSTGVVAVLETAMNSPEPLNTPQAAA